MSVEDHAGVPVNVERFGSGQRKALLLHCFLGQISGWKRLASLLDDMLDITAFDLPGHGKSPEWDGAGCFHETATRIAAGIPDGPVDVVGHSVGATIALRLAMDHPEKVRSLVLIEPVYFAAARAERPVEQAVQEQDMGEFLDVLRAEDWVGAAKAFVEYWDNTADFDKMPEPIRNMLAAKMPMVGASDGVIYRDEPGYFRDSIVDRVNVPTLLVEGSETPPVIRLVNESLEARLPNAKRTVVDGASHMVPMTHAEGLATELRAFYSAMDD